MLHVSKFERYPSADRTALAMAALEWCRAAREHDGVNESRFYWIDPNASPTEQQESTRVLETIGTRYRPGENPFLIHDITGWVWN